ncbi:hypothetical protein SLEP1_g20871 [Rubroshorea leprosula]|uniref:Uncharacterized protein n=1 Tax=Rubroshorea leprosula TaxID=152421 RepID=A0AAV5JA69_9ROSI|nr:hypothetical protein SLEP1_g20871 [Rubroshorea leprosula]
MRCNLRVCLNLKLYFPIPTCFRYLFPGLSGLITTTTASLSSAPVKVLSAVKIYAAPQFAVRLLLRKSR